jgi:hypothetical protein
METRFTDDEEGLLEQAFRLRESQTEEQRAIMPLLTQAFRDHIRQIVAWLEHREEIPVCRMGFRKLLSEPLGCAQTVCDFLELNLNVEAMARAVDISLYRNRCS